MKYLGALVAGILVAATLGSGTPVAAKTISVSDEITIQSRVLPRQSIIVNDKNQIIKIISNTTEDLMPKVYRNVIDSENELMLTEDLLKQYRSLVPLGTSQPGERTIVHYSPPLLLKTETSLPYELNSPAFQEFITILL